MSKRIPIGFTQQQWQTIIDDLGSNSSTANDYRKVLNLLQNYKNGEYQITSLTKEQAKEYYDYLDKKEANGLLSKNTVHRYKATLRSLGARMEKHQDVFPNYVNPFARLVKNEKRSRTAYTKDMFLDPSVISMIRNSLSKLEYEEVLVLTFLMDLGLTPRQIEEIQVCDFVQEKDELVLNVPATQFTERKDDNLEINDSLPIKLVHKSVNGNTTWKYAPKFSFFSSFSEVLKEHIPTLGSNSDTRPFFLTARHMKYSYRVIHHVVTTIMDKIGLGNRSITPYQLSLYGIVRSYLLDENLRLHAILDQQLAKEEDVIKRSEILSKIKEVESIFIPLAKQSWIGNWKQQYPLPMLLQINAIKKQLGDDFLLEVVGL